MPSQAKSATVISNEGRSAPEAEINSPHLAEKQKTFEIIGWQWEIGAFSSAVVAMRTGMPYDAKQTSGRLVPDTGKRDSAPCI
jgi:hypothetical protein